VGVLKTISLFRWPPALTSVRKFPVNFVGCRTGQSFVSMGVGEAHAGTVQISRQVPAPNFASPASESVDRADWFDVRRKGSECCRLS